MSQDQFLLQVGGPDHFEVDTGNLATVKFYLSRTVLIFALFLLCFMLSVDTLNRSILLVANSVTVVFVLAILFICHRFLVVSHYSLCFSGHRQQEDASNHCTSACHLVLYATQT